MPTISVKRDELFGILGKTYIDEEFDELCFQYGLELDEVTTEKQLAIKEHEDPKGASEQVIYKIEIPANRYDLLCTEGISQALHTFITKSEPPEYKLTQASEIRENLPPATKCKIINTPETGQIRPYVVGAVLRNITFTPASYANFIDLQDKLHQNLCRKRTLVAIGTHDLDTVESPFEYVALPPDQIVFKPLNQTKEFSAVELMKLYSTESHLKAYLDIIRDSPVYPLIRDSKGRVLSMPPIINGEHSKITLNTKNVFIECTATDLNKATVVLDTIVTMFSVHCDPKFTVESVDVVDPKGNITAFPKLTYRKMTVDVEEMNKKVGIQISGAEMVTLLKRMGLLAEAISGDQLQVRIPPTRHDILHSCDLVEEIAIGYGFDRIQARLPESATIGAQFNINLLTELLRREIVAAGYTEALTFALCSRDDVSSKLRQELSSCPAVHIANPKTLEFQVARTTLIPGLLKTVASNKSQPLPLRLFEISDIVVKDSNKDVGAKNIRHVGALYYARDAGFQFIHGLLDRIMQLLNTPRVSKASGAGDARNGYYIQHHSDSTFLAGRCAQIILNGQPIGMFGILHPEVLTAFELTNPCSILEMNLEPFV